MKEKKDAVTLEAFFYLAFPLFSLFSLSVTRAFPFTYKRGNRMPHEREEGHIVEQA